MEQRDPNGHKVVSSSGKFMGWNTIHRLETGDRYMTRIWIGRLRLHIFHRGDEDPDPHDHPWDFWTFPLVPYVEEVTVPIREQEPHRYTAVVSAWRWNFREATHTHRVKGAWDGHFYGNLRNGDLAILPYRSAMTPLPGVVEGKKIVTLIWRSKEYRKWGFLKNRDGKWCWIGWRDYILGGGKNAPCE